MQQQQILLPTRTQQIIDRHFTLNSQPITQIDIGVGYGGQESLKNTVCVHIKMAKNKLPSKFPPISI